MSELNVYHHELRPNEYAEFYLKDEADKVIAELEESHKKVVYKTADLLQARDYAESLNEDFDDPDGAHYTVGMIKENG